MTRTVRSGKRRDDSAGTAERIASELTGGIHGGGVCIRKISGSVEVTSRSCPTFLQSQIFYVRTFAGYLLPNRGFQLLPCPAVLSVSALRAGALALAPTFTGLRAGRGAGLAWRPFRAPQVTMTAGSEFDDTVARRSRMRHRAVRGFWSQAQKHASPVAVVGRSPPKPFFMRAPIWGR